MLVEGTIDAGPCRLVSVCLTQFVRQTVRRRADLPPILTVDSGPPWHTGAVVADTEELAERGCLMESSPLPG